ncbi:MAG: imidazoleglycerol-phosphate dehydratase HisB [Planctomycetes bacterium]|nr:imidazoleglycerol-phosphate dehydratase HisB [Planctomycetota bacterium]
MTDMKHRTAKTQRRTKETRIELSVDLDGAGEGRIETGIGFLDHMLEHFARHGLVDLEVTAEGDLEVDDHHTTEDVGICLGQAVARALGDKAGIRRYGWASVPMDEALANAAVDLSGRAALVFRARFTSQKIGTFDTQLVEEFLRALAANASMTLHVNVPYGTNDHHIAEAIFKAVAQAFRSAKAVDPDRAGQVPSTKGSL